MKKEHLTIAEQIDLLRVRKNWPAFVIGGLIGAFVPIAAFMLSGHVFPENHDFILAWNTGIEAKINLIMLAAAAVFSSKSVFSWGLVMFDRDYIKAIGFCILVEGVMILSPVMVLRQIGFAVLLFINFIATGTGHLRKPVKSHPKGYLNATPQTKSQKRPKVTKQYIEELKSDGLTMPEIAKKVRVSKSTLYRTISEGGEE